MLCWIITRFFIQIKKKSCNFQQSIIKYKTQNKGKWDNKKVNITNCKKLFYSKVPKKTKNTKEKD